MFRKGKKNLRKVLLGVSNLEPQHCLHSRYNMPAMLRLSVVSETKCKMKNWSSVIGVILKRISQIPPAHVN